MSDGTGKCYPDTAYLSEIVTKKTKEILETGGTYQDTMVSSSALFLLGINNQLERIAVALEALKNDDQ